MQTQFNFAGFQFPRPVAMLPRKPIKARFAEFKQRKERVCGPYMTAPVPNNGGAFFYLESDFMPGMRWAWCDEVSVGFGGVIKHKGWFCDEYQDQTIRGLVFRLPHGRGFLAGWSMGEEMASELDTSYVYEDEVSAAHAADSMAERAAENQREYEESQREELEEMEG